MLEVDHYQVMEPKLLILIDTIHGRSWFLTRDTRWQPINYAPLTKAQRDSLSPETNNSTLDRWQMEAEGQRLKM